MIPAFIAYPNLRDELNSAVAEAASALQDSVEKGKQVFSSKLDELSADARAAIYQEIREKLHSKALPAVKEAATEDPDMPDVVKNVISGAIDIVWTDVAEEMMHALQGTLSPDVPYEPVEATPCFPNPVAYIRSAILYRLFSFNLTLWAKIRHPLFWLLTLIGYVPVYGVPPAWFLFQLVLIDKQDEYSLITLILNIKAAQLFVGLAHLLIGVFQFYFCANSLTSSCYLSGPGSTPLLYEESYIFCGFFVLGWVVFAFVPFSTKKGIHHVIEDPHYNADNRRFCGGQTVLFWFMLWDLVTFLTTTGLFIWTSQSSSRISNEWLLKSDLYCLQTIYELLSFPFFFISFPIVRNVIMHLRATGYNQNGECVPLKVEYRKFGQDSARVHPESSL